MAVGENHLRPHLIQFNQCSHFLLDGFSIRESPFWTIHLYRSEEGVVRHLDVHAHGHNNDGIDIDMTRRLLVEDCTFDQGDDAVVIKSGRNQDAWRIHQPTEDIVIRHCTVQEGHVLLGIGSEISGGVRNVYMHDCTAPGSVRNLFYLKTNHRRGAVLENIYMERVSARSMIRALGIDTDVLYQWRDLVPTYKDSITLIRGIHMRDVTCQHAKAIVEINGDPRLPVQDVTVECLHVDSVDNFISHVEHCEGYRADSITYDWFGNLSLDGRQVDTNK